MDELSAPLGKKKPAKSRKLPFNPLYAVGGVGALFIIVVTGWALTVDDPLGGEPIAVASAKTDGGKSATKADTTKPDGAKAQAGKKDGGEATASLTPSTLNNGSTANPPGTQTINIIDGASGKSQQVTISGGGDPAPSNAEQKLLERTRHGDVPRIGADGTRPALAYARQLKLPSGKTDAPRIAIVVTGLGISSNASNEALNKLPGAISFAFVPYGNEIDKIVARARSTGHEVLLQAPMEPFDYPDNDPGPQTLLTSLTAEQNVDRLQWLMSRFQGFVGIANYMGARFTASDQAMTPVLREVAKRGLIFVDDGSSARSIAGQIAGASNVPYAKSDVTIDAVPTPAEIDRALGRLEAQARERGLAVGVMSALPGAINRVADWSKKIESRGFVLVPITAIAIREKSS